MNEMKSTYKFSKYVLNDLKEFVDLCEQNSTNEFHSSPTAKYNQDVTIVDLTMGNSNETPKKQSESPTNCNIKQLPKLKQMLQENLIDESNYPIIKDILLTTEKSYTETEIQNLIQHFATNEPFTQNDLKKLGFLVVELDNIPIFYKNFCKFLLETYFSKADSDFQLMLSFLNHQTDVFLNEIINVLSKEKNLEKSLQNHMKCLNDEHKIILLRKMIKHLETINTLKNEDNVLIMEICLPKTGIPFDLLKGLFNLLNNKRIPNLSKVTNALPKLINDLAIKVPKEKRHLILNDFKILINSCSSQNMWHKKLQKQLNTWEEEVKNSTAYTNDSCYNFSETFR